MPTPPTPALYTQRTRQEPITPKFSCNGEQPARPTPSSLLCTPHAKPIHPPDHSRPLDYFTTLPQPNQDPVFLVYRQPRPGCIHLLAHMPGHLAQLAWISPKSFEPSKLFPALSPAQRNSFTQSHSGPHANLVLWTRERWTLVLLLFTASSTPTSHPTFHPNTLTPHEPIIKNKFTHLHKPITIIT